MSELSSDERRKPSWRQNRELVFAILAFALLPVLSPWLWRRSASRLKMMRSGSIPLEHEVATKATIFVSIVGTTTLAVNFLFAIAELLLDAQ